MPIDVSADVSAWCWTWIAPLVNRRRDERARANLAIAFPQMGKDERDRLVTAHWASLGRVMAETIQIDRIAADATRFTFSDPEGIFERSKDTPLGPVVATSLHLGNWELVGWPLTGVGISPAGVYRRVDNPYIDQFLRSKRTRIYPGGLWGRGRGSEAGARGREVAARKVLDHLGGGGMVCLVADLYERKGVTVPFFGVPAPSYKGPAQLALSTKSRVLVGRCRRVPPGSRFSIDVVEVKYVESSSVTADIAAITTAIQAQFEAWIRETPEQWMWSNRRWS